MASSNLPVSDATEAGPAVGDGQSGPVNDEEAEADMIGDVDVEPNAGEVKTGVAEETKTGAADEVRTGANAEVKIGVANEERTGVAEM